MVRAGVVERGRRRPPQALGACPARATERGFIFLVGRSVAADAASVLLDLAGVWWPLGRLAASEKLFDLLTRRACTTDAPNGRTKSDGPRDAGWRPHGRPAIESSSCATSAGRHAQPSLDGRGGQDDGRRQRPARSSARCCVRLLGRAARALCTGGRAVIIFGCLCARQQSRRVRRVGWLAVVFVIRLIMAVILCWLFSPLARSPSLASGERKRASVTRTHAHAG